MHIAYVLPWSWYTKKLQNWSHFNCGLQIRQIRIQLITIDGVETVEKKLYKVRITGLDELRQWLRTEWAKLDHVVIAAAIRQWRHR